MHRFKPILKNSNCKPFKIHNQNLLSVYIGEIPMLDKVRQTHSSTPFPPHKNVVTAACGSVL